MRKKIIAISIALTMMFAIGLLGACEITSNPTLAEYRASAITVLQDYADALCEDDYCEANWERIKDYVDSGIDAINAASTKPAVDTALNTAKSNMVAW